MLESGKSRAAISHNIATEVSAGKPQNQAVAIAMQEAHKEIHAHAKDHNPGHAPNRPIPGGPVAGTGY